MNHRKLHPVVCGVGLVLLLAVSSTTATTKPVEAADRGAQAGLEALEWAFKFASAIETDPTDKAMAQQGVVADYASLEALDEAVVLADRIEGWRRGVAYADLATLLAQEGKPKEARALLEKARNVRGRTEGWQGPRISAHIAGALAMLGDLDASRRIVEDVAEGDPRQYLGRAAATVAVGHASRGDFDKALASLAELDDQQDLDLSWWRTAGYLALADMESLDRSQQLRALEAAKVSAEGVPGARKLDAFQRVATRYHGHGMKRQAREALEITEAIVLGIADDMPMKGPLLSRQARGWSEIGERDRARKLLAKAEPLVEAAMVIEQPGIYADYGASHLAIGDREAARRMYDRAVASAESLVNARPRALAVVAICRSMAREELGLDDGLRARLDALYRGLEAPW